MEIAVNYLAVLAAAVAAFGLGFLWYGPVFGKQWRTLTGMSLEEMKSMPLSPIQAMSIGFVTTLLMAYVLAHVLGLAELAIGEINLSHALQGGFWVWLGFIVPLSAGVWLWEGKSFKLFLFNATHYIVSIEIMAAILALWR
jgi:hypothetical protein